MNRVRIQIPKERITDFCQRHHIRKLAIFGSALRCDFGPDLEHTREAVTPVRGKERQDLDSKRVLSLALIRLLEIIGEAASRVTKELQAQNPGVAWSQIVGPRNRLIHGYDSVDMDILWQILTADLPRLGSVLILLGYNFEAGD
jgi:uncharacterized protein with HEPN domain